MLDREELITSKFTVGRESLFARRPSPIKDKIYTVTVCRHLKQQSERKNSNAMLLADSYVHASCSDGVV